MNSLETLLSVNDGSGRPLRSQQVKALTFIHDNWNPKKHTVIQAGVSVGKTAILRSIQNWKGGHVVTSMNTLVEQAKGDYPDLNVVIGKQHYKCTPYLSNCGRANIAYKCQGDQNHRCPMLVSRENFAANKPSILNAMSAYMARKQTKLKPGINSADEAHQLVSMLRQMTTTTLKFGPMERAILKKMKIEKSALTSEIALCNFLQFKIDTLTKKLDKGGDERDMSVLFKDLENSQYTFDALSNNPETFVLDFDGKHISAMPLKASRYILDMVLGDSGVVTSATMLDIDIEELLGTRDYRFLDVGTGVPESVRPVVWEPLDFDFGYKTIDPIKIAAKICEIYKRNPVNTLVHITYSLAQRIRPYMSVNALYHDQDNKADIIKEFKERGGLLIGSGMAEGLDLKGKICEQQIIAQITYPNLGDKFVQKRKCLSDGNHWYNAQSYKTLAQQLGRASRGPEDHSITYVLDNRFKRAVQSWRASELMPDYVYNSIEFGRNK